MAEIKTKLPTAREAAKLIAKDMIITDDYAASVVRIIVRGTFVALPNKDLTNSESIMTAMIKGIQSEEILGDVVDLAAVLHLNNRQREAAEKIIEDSEFTFKLPPEVLDFIPVFFQAIDSASEDDLRLLMKTSIVYEQARMEMDEAALYLRTGRSTNANKTRTAQLKQFDKIIFTPAPTPALGMMAK